MRVKLYKLYLLCVLSCVVINSNLVFADSGLNPDNIKYEKDKAILKSCKFLGHNLYDTCVKSVVSDPRVCTGMEVKYIACVTELNAPAELELANGLHHPYSPCNFEISYVILSNICRKKI